MQQVTNLERQENSTEDAYRKFDIEVHWRLKEQQRGNNGEKPNTQYWADSY